MFHWHDIQLTVGNLWHVGNFRRKRRTDRRMDDRLTDKQNVDEMMGREKGLWTLLLRDERALAKK